MQVLSGFNLYYINYTIMQIFESFSLKVKNNAVDMERCILSSHPIALLNRNDPQEIKHILI